MKKILFLLIGCFCCTVMAGVVFAQMEYKKEDPSKNDFPPASFGNKVSSGDGAEARVFDAGLGKKITIGYLYGGLKSGIEKAQCVRVQSNEELEALRQRISPKRNDAEQELLDVEAKMREQKRKYLLEHKEEIIKKSGEPMYNALLNLNSAYDAELSKKTADFNTHEVFALFKGACSHCSLLKIVKVEETSGITTVFVGVDGFQSISMGDNRGNPKEELFPNTPYLVFTVPKSSQKIVIKEGVANAKVGEPVWQTILITSNLDS